METEQADDSADPFNNFIKMSVADLEIIKKMR
jgi:hypothetical protein